LMGPPPVDAGAPDPVPSASAPAPVPTAEVAGSASSEPTLPIPHHPVGNLRPPFPRDGGAPKQ
jgi:hypothetical protein